MIINEGPLKGRHILLLEPVIVTEYFRFLALPPELRTMVYGFLFEEKAAITFENCKPVGKPRRPVRAGFRYFPHQGMTWSKDDGKWIGQVPSNHSIMRVNKQLLQEAAAVAYGTNTFSFSDTNDLKIFVDTIGDMRAYLKHLEIRTGYNTRKARSAFYSLRSAKALRSITIFHGLLCKQQVPMWYSQRYHTTIEGLVFDATSVLSLLHRGKKPSANVTNVLDILRVGWDKADCLNCKNSTSENVRTCTKCYSCETKCNKMKEACEEMTVSIRELVAKELRITE